MNHLDLFSGIGGFALAASWVWGDEHNIVSFVEIDPFCQKVLAKNFPGVPIQSDIKEYKHDGTEIDILTGGYPCQAFSNASHGHIIAEDLSPSMFQTIKKVQPKFVVSENVAKKTIYDFAVQLSSIGYRTAIYRFAASEIGADHKRNRWFAVAHSDNESELFSAIDAKASKLQSLQESFWSYENYAGILRISNGIPNRLHRLKSLGNAIVPQVVVPIMQAIKEIDYTSGR